MTSDMISTKYFLWILWILWIALAFLWCFYIADVAYVIYKKLNRHDDNEDTGIIRVVISFYTIANEDPPIPYLIWDMNAIMRYLELNGFDLNREITVREDSCCKKTIFEQKRR